MKKNLIVLSAIAIALCALPAWYEFKYNFVGIKSLAEQEIAAKMVIPIFKDAGFDVNVVLMPGERARVESTSGRKDGEILRIFSFGEKNPSLIRVPTPYWTVETTAFALKSRNISIKTKNDLAKYKLVIIRGVQTTRDLTAGLPNVYEMNDLELMMNFLKKGRADIAITSDIGGLAMLKKLQISEIVPIRTFSSLPLYIYFHEKNRYAVARIDAVIREKLKNGELKKLQTKYEKEYLDSIK